MTKEWVLTDENFAGVRKPGSTGFVATVKTTPDVIALETFSEGIEPTALYQELSKTEAVRLAEALLRAASVPITVTETTE